MTRRWDCGLPCPREGCEGTVRVHGYYDPGSWAAFVAPEGESYVDACDRCKCDDWTDDEVDKLTDDAQ